MSTLEEQQSVDDIGIAIRDMYRANVMARQLVVQTFSILEISQFDLTLLVDEYI